MYLNNLGYVFLILGKVFYLFKQAGLIINIHLRSGFFLFTHVVGMFYLFKQARLIINIHLLLLCIYTIWVMYF